MGRKTSILPIISVVLIFLMIIAIPSFAQFFDDGVGEGADDFFDDGFGEGADDFFDGVGDGGDDFFDGVGDGGDDFFDGVGDSGDDFFDGVGGGADDFFDGVGDSDNEFDFGAIDDDDGFDGWDDDFPGDDDPIDFPTPDPDDPPEFPDENADVMLSIVDSPDPVNAGGVLTYTITYNNVGYSEAENVVISLIPDASTIYISATPDLQLVGNQLLWDIGELAPQTSGTITMHVGVDSFAAPGSILSALFELNFVDSTTGQQHSGNAVVETVIATPVVPQPQGANIIASVVDSPDPVRPGETVSYTLSLTNNGDMDAENIEVTVACDSNLLNCDDISSLFDLDAGLTQNLAFDGTVDSDAAHGSSLSTTFRITYTDTLTGMMETETVTSTTAVWDPAIPLPSDPEESSMPVSLKVISTSFPFTTTSGGTIPIYITVENNGAEKLEDTKITIVNQELALRSSVGPFDLSRGQATSKTLLLEIPEYTPYGPYMLRFTISSNSQIRRVVYRELDVI